MILYLANQSVSARALISLSLQLAKFLIPLFYIEINEQSIAKGFI